MSEQSHPELRLDQGFMERAHATIGSEFAKYKYDMAPGDIMVDANGRYSFEVPTFFGDHCITVRSVAPGRFLVIAPIAGLPPGRYTEENGVCFLDIGTGKFKVTKQTLVNGEQVVMKTFTRLPEKYTSAALVSLVFGLVGSLIQGYRMQDIEKQDSKDVLEVVSDLTQAILKASPSALTRAEELLRPRANKKRDAGSLPGPARAPPAPVRPPIPAHPAAVGGGQAQHPIAPPLGGVQHDQGFGMRLLAEVAVREAALKVRAAFHQAALSAQAAAGAQAVAGALAGPGAQHMHALVAPQPMPAADALGGPQPMPAPGALGGPQPMPAADALGGPQPMPAADALGGPQPMPAAGALGGPQPMPASVGPAVGAGGGGDGGAAAGALGGPQPMLAAGALGGPQPMPAADAQPMPAIVLPAAGGAGGGGNQAIVIDLSNDDDNWTTLAFNIDEGKWEPAKRFRGF